MPVDSLQTEPEGKPKNTRVGSLSLLHRIFPTQESIWGLLHCRQLLYQLSTHTHTLPPPPCPPYSQPQHTASGVSWAPSARVLSSPIPRGGHCPRASFNFGSSSTGVCLSGCRSLGPSAKKPELREEPGVAEPALWGALHLQKLSKGKPWAPGSGRPSPAPWPGAPHPCQTQRYLGR